MRIDVAICSLATARSGSRAEGERARGPCAPCPEQPDQIDDVAAYLYLTRSRAERLAPLTQS